jgi:F-type H+-transporting ATPase subunit a
MGGVVALGCSFPILVGVMGGVVALLVISLLGGNLGKSMFGDVGLPSWLLVDKPEPHLPTEVVFHIGEFPIANTVIAAWITIAVLAIFCYVATRRMKLIPSRLQAAFEFVMGYLYDFCGQVAGEKYGRKFFPVVATIFLFVITNAWLSLVPGFGSINITNPEGEVVHLLRGANTDFNMPLALAVVSVFFVQYFGLKERGSHYAHKFFNYPPLIRTIKRKPLPGESAITGFIHIIVGLLELLSEFIRIMSFTFRLFGNMTAGEILLLIAMFLMPFIFALPFYGLELLVGFVQALIFGGLTLVFLTMAVSHGEAEGAAEEH